MKGVRKPKVKRLIKSHDNIKNRQKKDFMDKDIYSKKKKKSKTYQNQIIKKLIEELSPESLVVKQNWNISRNEKQFKVQYEKIKNALDEVFSKNVDYIGNLKNYKTSQDFLGMIVFQALLSSMSDCDFSTEQKEKFVILIKNYDPNFTLEKYDEYYTLNLFNISQVEEESKLIKFSENYELPNQLCLQLIKNILSIKNDGGINDTVSHNKYTQFIENSLQKFCELYPNYKMMTEDLKFSLQNYMNSDLMKEILMGNMPVNGPQIFYFPLFG